MSINPLELLEAARLIKVITKIGMIPPWTRTFVFRIDNTGACACVNAGRTFFKTILGALRVFVDVQKSCRIDLIAHHILTERNTVSD